MSKPFDMIEYAKDCVKSAGNPGANDLITVTMPLERYKSVFEALLIAVEELEEIAKPRLGGKTQQYMAQATLSRIRSL